MANAKVDELAAAIVRTLESPNEADINYEPANVVDALFFIGRAIHRLSEAVAVIAEKHGNEP